MVNKIDLPGAQPEEVAMEIEQVLGLPTDDCIFVSAKTGEGVTELLDAICTRFPDPPEPTTDKLRALIFDSHYDDYRGVVISTRVFDGTLEVGQKIRMMGTGRTWTVTDLGKNTPFPVQVKQLKSNEAGWMVASIKTLGDVRVGDTITLENDLAEEPLPGYEEPKQMVFCDFYPATSD